MLGAQRLNRYDNADERINPFNLSKNQCKARKYRDLLRLNKWNSRYTYACIYYMRWKSEEFFHL